MFEGVGWRIANCYQATCCRLYNQASNMCTRKKIFLEPRLHDAKFIANSLIYLTISLALHYRSACLRSSGFQAVQEIELRRSCIMNVQAEDAIKNLVTWVVSTLNYSKAP